VKSEIIYIGEAGKDQFGHYRVNVRCTGNEEGCRNEYTIDRQALKFQLTCGPCCRERKKRPKVDLRDDFEANTMANMKW